MIWDIINGALGVLGGAAIFVVIICLALPRIGAHVTCALAAILDARKAFVGEFKASFKGRMERDFPCERSILRGSRADQDPTF